MSQIFMFSWDVTISSSTMCLFNLARIRILFAPLRFGAEPHVRQMLLFWKNVLLSSIVRSVVRFYDSVNRISFRNKPLHSRGISSNGPWLADSRILDRRRDAK